MKFVFPYGVRFLEDGRVEAFPAADISVLGRRGSGIRALFHIDSGATTSVLPAQDAVALGVRLVRGKRMLARGLGDALLPGYRHTIKFQFGRSVIVAPVIFIEHDAVPRILGREGIFMKLAVLFDEARHRVGFLDRRERKAIEQIFTP